MARKAAVVAAVDNTRALAGGLEELESVIAMSAATVLDAGRALRRIRDERMYVGGGETGWTSFNEYCQQRWDMVREAADRMIRCSDVADALIGNGRALPRSSHALYILAPMLRASGADEVLAAWDEACDRMGGPRRVTAAALDVVIKDRAGKSVVEGTSEVISEEAVPAAAEGGGAEPVELTDAEWEERISAAIEEGESGGGSASADPAEVVDPEEDVDADAYAVVLLERLTRALTAWRDAGDVVAALAAEAAELSAVDTVGGSESGIGIDLDELISNITESTEETLDSLRDVLEDAEGLPVPDVSPVPAGAVPLEELDLDDDGFPVPVVFSD